MIFGRVTKCEPGTGHITSKYVIVTYEHGDHIPNLGDRVWLNGIMYEIRGIESRKNLGSVPTYYREFVFRIKDVLDE